MTLKFYLDTCTYVKLLHSKEQNNKITRFFDYCKRTKAEIYYSTAILTELEKVIGTKYKKFFDSIKKELEMKQVEITNEQFIKAKKIHAKNYHLIGLMDSIHFIISKENDLILVTLDNNLIFFSEKEKVTAIKPDYLI